MRCLTLALLILLLSGSLPAPTSGSDAGAQEMVRWIVGLDPFPERLDRGDTWNEAQVLRVDAVLGFIVVLADATFPLRASSREEVRYVEQDLLMALTHTPNDPRWSGQYGPRQVAASTAWDITKGTADKVLCVVDSGLRTTHQDIKGTRWLGGRDIADGDNNVADPHGHGTHVTGIAVATMDNALGIAGIAQTPFKVAKVMESATGNIWQSDTSSGIRWCADNGGHIINLSLGNTQTTSALRSAVEYAYGKDVLILAASGNDGCNNCVLYPARFAEVMAVGCTDSSNNRCYFSNGGPEVELAAPGYQIDSTCRGSDSHYCTLSGTSMSSPTAAGVAALVWSYASHLSRNEMRTVLQNSATDRGSAGRDTVYGYGIPHADRALGLARPIPPVASFVSTCSAATCVFDGRASSDEDGRVAQWTWHLGDGQTRSGASIQYDYTTSGTYTVVLNVTDNHGFTDETSGSVTVDVPPPLKAPPMAPPGDPHVVDTQQDLVGDRVPSPHMDVESAWFDDDSARLYVGMKVANIVNDRATAFVAYRVQFTPTWTLTDPTLGGKLPAHEEVVRYEVRAIYSPVGLPAYPRTTFELWADTKHTQTMQHASRQLGEVAGSLSAGTDIIWWPVDRLSIGAPADATLTLPSAMASPFVRGVIATFGVTADATGSGRTHTF